MNNELLLIGAGGHARSVIDVIEAEGNFTIGGLVGTPEECNLSVLGYSVLGSDKDLELLRERFDYALVCIGQIDRAEPRRSAWADLKRLAFTLPVVVSPRAWVSPRATLQPGCVVMHGAIVNTGATLGENCIINSMALIEHDCSVGAHCHIATGARVNGNVQIGEGSFIGSGSVLKQGICLGAHCTVGMSQNVRHNVADRARIAGS